MKLPKRFWDDKRWAREHMIELQQKYTNKWVAIVNQKIEAIADGPEQARGLAEKKTGLKQIPVIFVESGQNLY